MSHIAPTIITTMWGMKKRTHTPIPVNNLKHLRRETGWSQYDLELASGISQSRLSLLERGIRPMSAEDLETLAQAFSVTPDRLFPHDRAK